MLVSAVTFQASLPYWSSKVDHLAQLVAHGLVLAGGADAGQSRLGLVARIQCVEVDHQDLAAAASFTS